MNTIKSILLIALIVILISSDAQATRRARIVVSNPDNFISISQTLGKKEIACHLDKKGRLTPGVMKQRGQRTIWLNLKKRLRRLKRDRNLIINSRRKYRRLKRKIRLFRRACREAQDGDSARPSPSPSVDPTSGPTASPTDSPTSTPTFTPFPTATPDGTWVPPLGIPAPSFGIFETHMMYEGETYDFGSGPEPYKDAGNGPYTHYVDSTHPAATNTDNPYGSPDKPRLSFQRDLPAGSVVEIHNSALQNGWGAAQVTGVGTAQQPIFIRGIGLPRLDISLEVGYYGNSQFIIVEGISAFRGGIIGRANGTSFVTSFISIRNCDFHGDESAGGFGIGTYTDNPVQQIVLYNNSFHDNGVWDPEIAVGDQDNHGIGVGGGVTYLWVVDNEMYHNSGDGIQVGNSYSSQYIYVGRNVSHHNKQSGFWTKSAYDVIFSENTSYGHRPSSSSSGPGMGFQYDPKRVWFLFNHSYDNNHGLTTGSGNLGGREEFYLIGNVIHDSPNGITLNGVNTPEPVMIIGNTIYNTENGILNGYYSSKMNIINNIIAASDNQIYFTPGYQTPTLSAMSYNLLQGPISIVWGGSYSSLSGFQTATSQCSGCLEGDPQFVNPVSGDFHLQSSSPAESTAASSSTVQDVYDRFLQLYGIDIQKDKDGKTLNAPWDMGAYEYQ